MPDATSPVQVGIRRWNGAVKTITIANGASLGDEIDVEGYTLFAIEMPATWTAANLTFEAASTSGGTFLQIVDDGGTEVVVTASASVIIGLDAKAPELAALRFIKLRSGTKATPVNQAAARTIKLICKG